MQSSSSLQPPVRTVLAPLAFSPRAAAVACEARRWAAVLGAELLLLHVGKDDQPTRRQLEERLQGHGLSAVRLEIRDGKPGRTIVRAAVDLGADLIVAGALEKEGALSYYVGSVARQVARRAGCSVLLLTQPRVDPQPTRRWAMTVPRDDASRQMLRFMSQLAAVEKPQRIDLIGEYDMSGTGLALEGDLDLAEAEDRRAQIHRQEQAKLAEFVADTPFTESPMRLICLRGRVGHESAEHARRTGADLLISPAPASLGFWDKFIQHGVEFALESLPCSMWLYRGGQRR